MFLHARGNDGPGRKGLRPARPPATLSPGRTPPPAAALCAGDDAVKLLDKYILRQLAMPLACCLATFGMLFIVFDLFDHFSDFLEAHTPLLLVVRYYAFLLPALLVYVVPLSLLLGLLYSLWQHTRHNELTAMRASGVSLLRITVPILAVGLAASVLIGVLQETVAPRSSYWASQFVRRQKQRDDPAARIASNLTMKHEAEHRIWAIRSFNLATYDMQGVTVVQQRPDGSDQETLHAEEGKYYDDRWWLFRVTIKKYNFDNRPIGPVETFPSRQMADWTETPQDFLLEVMDPMCLSSRDLRQFIRTHAHLSDRQIARIRVDLHARLAMPWTCLVVVLFGIPCGVRTARQGAFAGVLTALLTFFAFYLLMVLGQWLGKNLMLTPLASAWLPNLAFAGAGLALLSRMR